MTSKLKLNEVVLTSPNGLVEKSITMGDDGIVKVDGNIISSTSDWNLINATLTYASADSPTFVANTSVDLTSVISVGMKIKLTQTTVKYFIVTAITSTTITLYGGTDYTLANATITLPYFSSMKAPFGFPLNPDKWSVTVVTSTTLAQPTPTQNTYYNISSFGISVPIGLWKLGYKLLALGSKTTGGAMSIQSALSTSNNSVSDINLKGEAFGTSVGTLTNVGGMVIVETLVSLTSKTQYYLICCTLDTGMTSINFFSSDVPTTIKAVCAYL